MSLESVNLRGHFIRHQDFQLWLARADAGNTETFSGDASFIALDGFVAEPVPCGAHRVGTAAAIPANPVTVPTFVSTERIGQLTGSTDPAGLPILNDTNQGEWVGAGVEGVDLGANVEHKDRLYFFFGDVAGAGAAAGSTREGVDLVGWTTDTALRPGGFTLHPVKAGPGQFFDPYSVDSGIGSLGLALAPSGGFSYKVAGNDTIFVFALWKDPSNPLSYFPTTVLASKEDPAQPGPAGHAHASAAAGTVIADNPCSASHLQPTAPPDLNDHRAPSLCGVRRFSLAAGLAIAGLCAPLAGQATSSGSIEIRLVSGTDQEQAAKKQLQRVLTQYLDN